MRRSEAVLLAGLAACHPFRGTAWQGEVDSGPALPALILLAPEVDAVLDAGATLEVRADVDHPAEAVGALHLALELDGELVDPGEIRLTADGRLSWTTEVSAGWSTGTLEVTDSAGHTAQVALSWRGNRPPAVALLLPADGGSLAAGEPLVVDGVVSDPDHEDGDVEEAPAVRWLVDDDVALELEPDDEGRVYATLEALEPGDHTVTLEADDGVVLTDETVFVRALD